MSEFLLIVPAGWSQLDWAYLTNNVPGFGESSVLAWCGGGQVDNDIGTLLREAGQIPADAYVYAAKLVDATYFLVKMET